jgi:hypothetical protein
MSMNEKIPLAEGWTRLTKEVVEGKPPKIANPTHLSINEIVVAHSVFQPRTFDGNTSESVAHVSALADAIRLTPSHHLDALVVWWSGKYWRLIDGHHRQQAYKQTLNDSKKPIVLLPVPVIVFQGTLSEAFVEAIRLNSKDKLSMTKLDKLDRAWRLVALNHDNKMTKQQIASIAKVAERTVTNMRSTYSEMMSQVLYDGFTGAGPKFHPDMLLNIGWGEAKKQTLGETPKDDEWAEKQAKEWARRMAKGFGMKLAKNPSIAARAIELYSEKLPERLLEIWRELSDEVDAEI